MTASQSTFKIHHNRTWEMGLRAGRQALHPEGQFRAPHHMVLFPPHPPNPAQPGTSPSLKYQVAFEHHQIRHQNKNNWGLKWATKLKFSKDTINM